MGIILHDTPLEQAQERFHQALEQAGLWKPLGLEQIALDENALGRVLAEPVWARISSPHYNSSAMDGFALLAEDTSYATQSTPVDLLVGKIAFYVDTGEPLPKGVNAVVPIEDIEPLDKHGAVTSEMRHPHAIRLQAPLKPWRNVRLLGEDIVATQLVLPGQTTLRPVDLGAIAASGHSTVSVSRLPRVGVIPTGNELVQASADVKPGDIIELNSIVLAAQVKLWGGIPTRYPITADSFDEIRETVQKAADENDLILLNAGSSAGSEDFSAKVIEALGTLLVQGVSIKPGHPVILGMVRRSVMATGFPQWVPILGIPGYPVAAALACEIFVTPLIDQWLGRASSMPEEITANLTQKVTSPAEVDEYLRVVVGRVGSQTLAAPLSRGAGVITSLMKADGIAVLPRGVRSLEAGSNVIVRLHRAKTELENTIFLTGSHDMAFDMLACYLNGRGRRLVTTYIGSQGGLAALQKREAHIAGSHLLDPATGEYNLNQLALYLADAPVSMVGWARREQGLIVQVGNPKGITSIEDLARDDVCFINRQQGSGTRALLDNLLQKNNLSPARVRGYAQEECTHLAVAAAVASGRADCGLGIAAAAYALGLKFIPMITERFDLIISCEYRKSDLLRPLFELMQDAQFRKDVASLPGYDVSVMGNEIVGCIISEENEERR